MRIAVCDDQADCRRQTELAIKQCIRSMGILVDTYKDGFSFLHAYKKKPYDLVFLDIEMPEIDGISLAKKLREQDQEVPIVFLTSHIEYALDGYEVNALRYLTKPINIAKLHEVLSYVMTKMQAKKSLWIKSDLFEEKVPIQSILYMEAQNQNILICTKNDSYSVRYNMGDYEEELREDGFFRIHRGYLVSLRHIKNMGKHEITLADGTVLPVSRSKEKDLKETLFQYIRREAI